MRSALRPFSSLRILLRWSVLVVALPTAGCALLDFSQEPAEVTGAVVAAETLNPRRDGQSTSVVLHLYQLETPTEFSQADFFTLHERADATLGPGALIRELVVLPGSTTILDTMELAVESAYIGVMVAFRDWRTATWSAVLETPANKRTILDIQLVGSEMSLTKGKRGWLRRLRKGVDEEQEAR